jgi:hypothetical protein
VQPVLDRYCIRCHGLEGTPGEINLLGTPGEAFSASYASLVGREGLVEVIHWYRETDRTTPRLHGAHAGRLIPLLRGGGHAKRVRLDRDSLARIGQWLDLNAQFYGDYRLRRPEQDRPSAEAVAPLRSHVRATCGSCHRTLADEPLAALVNVAMPSESRLLKAPLAGSAGGWSQCARAWPDTSAQGYRKMSEAIRRCLSARPSR